MKINCLSCGHSLELGDAYDDYQGPVRCFICGALLKIATRDGHVKSAGLATREASSVEDTAKNAS